MKGAVESLRARGVDGVILDCIELPLGCDLGSM
jgi:aspartate/glutamate racemase